MHPSSRARFSAVWVSDLGGAPTPHKAACSLLTPPPPAQVREDIKRGCYVEGLSEEIVQNGELELSWCAVQGSSLLQGQWQLPMMQCSHGRVQDGAEC